MFTGEPNRKRYTAADIHRYHSDLMSPAERNTLEKAALEDPFLEEALEGYARVTDPTKDLELLSARLDKRVQRKRRAFVVFMRTWGAAAAVLVVVLVGGGIFIRYLGSHPKQSSIVARQAPAPKGAPASESRVVPAADSVAMILRKPRRNFKPKPILKGEALVAKPAEAPIDSMQGRVAEVAAAPPMANIFRNRVIDNQNQPVAFATIRPLNSKSGVSSDANGYFGLPLSDTNALVSVSAVGYATREVNTNQQTPIQLDPLDISLSEVVVSSNDRKSFAAEAKRANGPYHAIADSSNLEPIDGWDDYNHYITTSLHLPEEVLQKNIHGDVALSFQLDKAGNPVHVDVVQSLCNGCDAEAKRLLLQGPQWKKKGKGRKGRLRVHF